MSYIDSGEGRGKKVCLPWGEGLCGVLLISLFGEGLCVAEPAVCFLYFCGASALRFELVMSQVSGIVIDREMKELFDLAQILPLGSWFVLSLRWECCFRIQL